MRKRAFITSFHNYSAPLGTPYHHVLFDYFAQQFPLWCDLVDAVYIIYTNWDFTIEDTKKLTDHHKNVVFYKAPHEGHHNFQYQEFLPQIQEDEMLFMDNDVLIFNRAGISDWFYTLKDYDAVITFAPWEKYPPHDLREPIWEKYPDTKGRGVYMDSCHFLLTKKLINSLDKIDFMNYQPYPIGTYIKELDYTTKAGEWAEFFAPLWFQILERNNWIEMLQTGDFKHIRGFSYAYLLLAYRKLGLPQYKEYLQYPHLYKERLKWFMKIDTNNLYKDEVLSILNDKL